MYSQLCILGGIPIQQPVYHRIRTDLSQRIEAGEYAPGARLPSEHELAARYGVARMTVREAVGGLVRGGLVVRRRGQGTFVASEAADVRPMNQLTSFTEDFGDDYEVRAAVLTQVEMRPNEDVATQLRLGEGAMVVDLERLRLLDARPVLVHRSWLPLGRFPSLARWPLEDRSLYEVLESDFGVRPARAVQRISAVAASPRLAEMLNLAAGQPLIALQRLTFDEDNEPIELARTHAAPDIPLRVELTR